MGDLRINSASFNVMGTDGGKIPCYKKCLVQGHHGQGTTTRGGDDIFLNLNLFKEKVLFP